VDSDLGQATDLKLDDNQKLKIFYTDYFAGIAAPLFTDTFRNQNWKKTGFDGLVIQIQMTNGANGLETITKSLQNLSLTPDDLVKQLGDGTVEATAKRLYQVLQKYEANANDWPEHSLGWLSRHPEFVVGKNGSLIDYVPKYADAFDKIVNEAAWGVDIVLNEWKGIALGTIATGAVGVIQGLRRAANITGGFRGPRAREWDWEHIYDRHSDFGNIAAQRAQSDQVFQGLTRQQIRARCQGAWANRSRVQTQQQGGTTRIQYEGVDPASGQRVRFWFNQNTRTVESAFPIAGE
jgi:hypothetical protein